MEKMKPQKKLEANTGEYLSCFQVGKDFLSTKPETVSTEEKTKLFDYIKMS